MTASEFSSSLSLALKSHNIACRDHGDGVVEFYGTDYAETMAVLQEDGAMLIVVDGDTLDEVVPSAVSIDGAVRRIVSAVATL